MARNLHFGLIPNGWKYDLLDKFAKRCSGHTPSKSYPEYWNGSIKWISLADSHRLDKGYVYETDKEISQEGINNSSAEIHPAETVVLSRDAGIGKSGIMAEPMAVSQHFIAWKCDNINKIYSWFLYYWLQLYQKEFERQAVGSTIKTIGLPYFKKLKIALPPFAEQKKIAQILLTWEKTITTTEKLLANSEQQKKALMHQLLTGKKRFIGFCNEWEKLHLRDCANCLDNKRIPLNSEQRQKIQGSIPYWGANGVVDFVNEYIFDETIVLLAEDGGYFDEYKTRPIANISYGKCWVNNHAHILCSKDNCITEWLYYSLVHKNIKAFVNGGTRAKLNKNDMMQILIPLPPLDEQKRIIKTLSTVDREIENIKQQLNYLKQEKKALMQQLLTGKRRV